MPILHWAVALFLVSFPLLARPGEYWVCVPMSTAQADPRILITRGEGTSLHFRTDADLVREEGKLPEGTYLGTASPTASGYSIIARLDVTKFFPNLQTGALGTSLSLALQLKSSLFGTEAYLLFPTESSDFLGTILNQYACKHRL